MLMPFAVPGRCLNNTSPATREAQEELRVVHQPHAADPAERRYRRMVESKGIHEAVAGTDRIDTEFCHRSPSYPSVR